MFNFFVLTLKNTCNSCEFFVKCVNFVRFRNVYVLRTLRDSPPGGGGSEICKNLKLMMIIHKLF